MKFTVQPEQALDLWQGEGFFRKGVELSFSQNLCKRSHALNSSSTGDKPVCPFPAVALFIVGGTVFKLLLFVPELGKLAAISAFSSGMIFCFGIAHDLFGWDGWDEKRPPTFSVDGLDDGMGFSGFAAGTVCVSRLFPLQSALG